MTLSLAPSGSVRIVLLALALIVFVLVSEIRSTRAQSVAQIGQGSPLPVYVTNAPSDLPDAFRSRTRWRFTTSTMPSTMSWTVNLQQVSGPWALMTVTTDDGRSTAARWYYVPGMAGSWEPL